MELRKSRIDSVQRAYLTNKGNELFDVYHNPSMYKVSAWLDIQREKEEHNGYGLTVIGANTMVFSCAYIYRDITANEYYMVYHTHANRYEFNCTQFVIEHGLYEPIPWWK